MIKPEKLAAKVSKYEDFHRGWKVVDMVKQRDRYKVTVKCKCGKTDYNFSSDNFKNANPLCRCVTPIIEGHKWVDTPKGLYSISSKGIPYSYLAKRYLSPAKTTNGSWLASLGGEQFHMHKLVAHYFNGIPLEVEVGFLDGNKDNCTPENLIKVECVYHERVGNKYGRLTVKEVVLGEGKPRVLCDCDCGTTFVTIANDVTNGHTKSCGCLTREATTKRNTTHNMTHTGVYRSYQAMITRCTNKNSHAYQFYGAKGITVCDRWLESFENFYEDMGERPDELSLDRIDPYGNYSPNNCRWADRRMQGFNQRMRITNTSGRTGVYVDGNSYFAKLGTESLGSFKSFEDAVKAREAAELETFGYIKEVWPCVK
jgi:hypothetical protein